MGHFIEDNLIPGEKIMYRATVHWMVYSPAFFNIFLAAVIFVMGKTLIHSPHFAKILPFLATVPLVIAVWKAIQAYIHREYTEIAVTNDRLIIKTGAIARETIELPLARIESVIVDQTMNERMINAGSIAVHGVGISTAPIRYIEEPMKFRNHLNEAIASAKQGGNNQN